VLADLAVMIADGGGALAQRAYAALTASGLDPRAAVLPTGLDPAATAERHGPAVLVDRLAMAEPMGRQLVAHALAGRELRWAEDRITAARDAARIITQAPADTWEREIAAVTSDTDLDVALLRTAVVDAVDTDTRCTVWLAGTAATTSTGGSTPTRPRRTSPRSAPLDKQRPSDRHTEGRPTRPPGCRPQLPTSTPALPADHPPACDRRRPASVAGSAGLCQLP
jgi:hypothetical protein